MKYVIKKEFGIYRHLSVPINTFMLKLSKCMLSAMPKGMKSSKDLSISKFKINGSENRKICIYQIKPKAQIESSQTIIYLHGGGFVFKAAPYHYKLAKEYALKSNSNVIFINYSLAFDLKTATPLDDCVFAYKFILENHERLGIDIKNICFAGDSAGSYLCLALINQSKAQNLTLPKKLMLVYPVVSPVAKTKSKEKFIDTPMWNAKANEKMWKIYQKGKNVFDPLSSDLSYFPKTYIETAEFDCLHDEGIMLFEKLEREGVDCIKFETSGTMHGFDICLKAPTTLKAVKKRLEFLCQK